VTRGHVQIGPHLGKVFLAHSEEVDALPAGELEQRDVVTLRDLGDAPQLRRGGDAAGDLRHDGECPVPLDIGVHPVVDEPAVPLVDVLLAPHRPQQRAQRHLRARVLGAVLSKLGEHRR
jgi:hypothetical protein